MAFTEDILKLERDVVAIIPSIEALVPQVEVLFADLKVLGVDFGLLSTKLGHAPTGAEIKAALAPLQGTRWQKLICMAIPLYNLFAMFQGLPPLPVPAFCASV